MKMFWMQLRQLMWKNLLIRSRSKLRVITELVWPIILFVILALVRTKGLKDYKNECFLEEKALPSAGSLQFLQSLICTFDNNCHNVPPSTARFSEEFNFQTIRNLVRDLTDVSKRRITDEEVVKGSGVAIDVAAAVAFAFKLLAGGSTPKVYFPLKNIVNWDAFQRLVSLKNATSTSALNELMVHVPSVDVLKNNTENPQQVFCDATVLKSWISAPDESTLQTFSQILCQSSTAEILRVVNGTLIINQIQQIVEDNLQQPLHLGDWANLGRLLNTIVLDIRDLNSLSMIFNEFNNTTLGKLSNQLWKSRDVEIGNMTSTMAFFNSTANILCGKNSLIRGKKSDFPDGPQSNQFRQRLFKSQSTNITRSGLTASCAQLFIGLQQNPLTRLVLQLFYPFIRGKIIYAPKTPAFDSVIHLVNETFQDLRIVQRSAERWLTEISPSIKRFLDQLDPGMIKNITEVITERFPVVANLTSSITNTSDQIILIRKTLVKLDLVANLIITYVECYEFDKFEGFDTEKEAVERGMDLIDTGGLWAVLVFKNQNVDLASQNLPHNITYKLRMDSSKIDSTKRLRDFFETPMPRTSPTRDMKYFTSGYIFLQDKIEQAIIKLQTNRTQLPGMYMQQFPSPCYTYDTFFMAIAGLFPLFMVLSFVYTCAMIVKSIVREKERRLKETMKTMGLGNGVHWMAWFIDSMSFMLISCVLLSMILVFGRVLENSNFLVVFIFVLSFSIATVCFSFLVSTFFSRANLAAACGGFFFFACFLPYNFLNLNGQDYSLSTLVLASLFSDVSFGIGCWYFASHEQSGEGAQWSNIAVSPKDGDAYSLLGCILMMLFDAVLYLVLTWYIETVFPGQYGIPKPWYFMFQPSYWCSEKRRNSTVGIVQAHAERDTELLEVESRDLMAGVSIRHLGKTYANGKVALSNLNLDFYEDQITSFLGHNGAGKTTTISILTGLFTPSFGTATINGLDIRYQMDEIRHQLGVCPQHNVLFDQLTVEEHLRFYANLKTGEQIESRKEIDKMIEDLGLSHKRHDISEHLSGGMKRKLSIGAAFIGNSKTVILDEPTAGVDPYSRRSIWDILLKYKEGRTIILTTHFMDEADLLGDRIAIISQGQLKCCGSSLFLKQKLGSGYYLTVVKKDGQNVSVGNAPATGIPISQNSTETDVERIVNAVKRDIQNASVVENVGSDIVFCLPEFDNAGHRQRDKFPRLFDNLDLNMEQLQVDSYGVSDTTLEEIFLKVANDPSEDNATTALETNQVTSGALPVLKSLQRIGTRECVYEEVPQIEGNDTSDTFNLLSSEKLTGSVLICQQFIALYVKRFCNSKRNLKGFFCEIVLPALLIIINQLTTMSLSAISPEPALELSPWLYGKSNVAFYANENPNEVWPARYIKNMVNETGMGAFCKNDDMNRLQCHSNITKLLNPLVNPADYQDFQCPCSMGIASCPKNLTSTELPRYRSVSADDFIDVTGKDISLWIIRTYKKFKKFRFGGFEFGLQNPFGNLNLTLFSQDVQNLLGALRFPLPLQANASGEILNFENLAQLRGSFDKVKVWYDNKAWASSVSYLNAINNVILRSSLPSSKNATFYSITAINHPMNYSFKQLEDRFSRQVGISVLHAISVIFSMSFVPASFVIFLVEERKSKAKHLQFVSGVKPITFWVAAYTWDMINYLIPCILVILIFVGFDQQAYIGPKNIQGMILLLVLYGLSAIPLMYPASLIFSVSSSAFVGLACANLFIGVTTTISSFVLQLFDDVELKLIGSILNEVYLIFPHYCLGRGMIDMAQVHFTTERLALLGVNYQRNIFEWDYLGRYFLSMVVQATLFFTFTVMLHYQVLPERVVRYFQTVQLPPLHLEDEDVARERERVERNDDSTDELRLLRLTKLYGRSKEPATNRLSFGLRRGECFGLLGVNGAGKSTTFKMLTGDETVTSGNAFVGGHSILSDLREAQQNLGYCPQEDALLSLLTGTEHLKLFAMLRGVPRRHMNKVITDSLKKLGLLPYKNRCAGTYSGGNKRKLSTAIALIGNPAVVFLDEPSSGMDPKARRSLWSAIIDALKDSRSILLTSHSMEECQVLCTRLAIMVNGTLRCLGSAQHLKNRFGNGYMISARCEVEHISDVLQHVQLAIPEARLRERRSRQLIWHIQPNVLSISALFNKMEAARETTNMVDYSITQTTLDDVFVRFARLQRETNEESEENCEQGFDDLPLHSRNVAGLANQELYAVSVSSEL
ncbi:phospholipid-transporting ATPase ABCA1-like [Daphnia carinata]|uniref:phospholipid-transporting ATPase ABCA1-like n=1 Tax=Daphnia carinata TaxID=120202 RepID=UPI002868EDD6|nr:phospholipid-transporting ATPase ABCA1-like [Daphnia carinata]